MEEKLHGEGNYGIVVENGVKYYLRFPRHKIWIYRVLKKYQYVLWKIGIPWHDKYFGECNPDFSCCKNDKWRLS